MKGLSWTAGLLACAALLGGCGEVTNTLTAPASSVNTITVALDAAPNFTQVGIFDAEALGYFRQTDEQVRFIVVAHPIDALLERRAQVAISNEPQIILTRNGHTALASIAAILQGPGRYDVSCHAAGTRTTTSTTGTATAPTHTTATTTTASARTPTTTADTTTSTPRSHPPLHAAACRATLNARPISAYAQAPTYNALNFVVTENEIVNRAPVLRRFIQAVGRGYAAARTNPTQATENLVQLNPGLSYPEQLAGVRASLGDFFPSGDAASRPWGWQAVEDWNAFGTWMLEHRIIDDVNATPDADTNELLAGQGV